MEEELVYRATWAKAAVRSLLLPKSKQLWIIVWLPRQERLMRKLWDMKELSKVCLEVKQAKISGDKLVSVRWRSSATGWMMDRWVRMLVTLFLTERVWWWAFRV